MSDNKETSLKIQVTNEESSVKIDDFSSDNDFEYEPKKPLLNSTFVQNFVDSFKKPEAPSRLDYSSDLEVSSSNQIAGFGKTTELQQNIKQRHILLIQLGTGIGTGLLVGNGDALAQAGPAGLFLGYAIVSTFIYCTMNSISELSISYSQLSGSYNEFTCILVDRGFGFAVACVYAMQWLCVMPLELTTSSMVIKYWTTSVNSDIFVFIFYILLVTVNFIGGTGYAEFEFIVNSFKVLMILGFIIYGIITDCGGSSANGYKYIGGEYWHKPYGAFYGKTNVDHFKGLCTSFVYAAMAYSGFESSVLTASEQKNPRKSIIKAGKMLLYRIVVIYCLTVLVIGLLVPYNSKKLMGNGVATTTASPLVIATTNIKGLPHIINAVILMAVLSVANNSLFCASRVILSICEQFFPNVPYVTYVDRRGRPLFGLCAGALFGCIGYAAVSKKESLLFGWLLSISGLAALSTQLSMNFSHIRFRKAMQVQGKSLNEMGFISKTGTWGSWYSVTLIFLVLIAQFWIALFPIGSNKASLGNFFQNYLTVVVFIVLYLGFKTVTGEWHFFIPADKIDLAHGRRIFNHELIEQEDLEEKEKIKNSSLFVRIADFWC